MTGLKCSTWPDLDEAAVRLRRGQHLLGLLQGGAERLLDQQVAALGEERQRDLGVQVRRDDDRDGVAGRAELVQRGEAPAAELGADLRRARRRRSRRCRRAPRPGSEA